MVIVIYSQCIFILKKKPHIQSVYNVIRRKLKTY